MGKTKFMDVIVALFMISGSLCFLTIVYSQLKSQFGTERDYILKEDIKNYVKKVMDYILVEFFSLIVIMLLFSQGFVSMKGDLQFNIFDNNNTFFTEVNINRFFKCVFNGFLWSSPMILFLVIFEVCKKN